MYKNYSKVKTEAIKRLKLLSEKLDFPEEILETYMHNNMVTTLYLGEGYFSSLLPHIAIDIAFLEEEFDCHIYLVMRERDCDRYHYFFVSNNDMLWYEEHYKLMRMNPSVYCINPIEGNVYIGSLDIKYVKEVCSIEK